MKRSLVAIGLLVAACGAPQPATSPPTPSVIPSMCHLEEMPTEYWEGQQRRLAEDRAAGRPSLWSDEASHEQLSAGVLDALYQFDACWERNVRDALIMGANEQTAVQIADGECATHEQRAHDFDERGLAAASRAGATWYEPGGENWLNEKFAERRRRSTTLALCHANGHLED